MRKINGIELFSGSGNLSSSFKSNGHNFISLDIRKRKGICMPDIHKNILDISSLELTRSLGSEKVDVLFIGLPCDIWSYASGGFHLDKDFNPLTEKCSIHLEIFNKCLALIWEISPALYFIENPRGKLRHYPPFLEFLNNTQGLCHTLTMSSYGFSTTKPTNVFTNAKGLVFKELDSFGRGAKCTSSFDNLTKSQRQKYPELFCQVIVNFCESVNFDTFE